MFFLNASEIDDAAHRHQGHPILGRATRFLQRFRDLIDRSSDGWCYWPLPVNAARKLMDFIGHPDTATEEGFKKALVPIKSFCTRHDLVCPTIEATENKT